MEDRATPWRHQSSQRSVNPPPLAIPTRDTTLNDPNVIRQTGIVSFFVVDIATGNYHLTSSDNSGWMVPLHVFEDMAMTKNV